MIRVLFMIAAAGFVLSVAALSAAVAIGGPDAVARGGWFLGDRGWWNHHEVRRGDDHWPEAGGAETTRTLAWSGADKLDIDLSADVRYVQAEGAATVTVTGPARAVERVVVRGDSIRYESGRRYPRPRLSIVVRAPNIQSFDVKGDNTLAIEDYKQPRLNADVSGDGEITAKGEVGEISLDVSGSGEADFAALKTKGVAADLSGAARAVIAPTEWADLEVSGAADVRLNTNPPRLETDITGAGHVRQGAEAAPPAGTSPPAASSPKGAKT